MKKLSVFISMVIFLCSASAYTNADAGRPIRIASFNIQVFGKAKADKPEVMRVLVKTIKEFDIVAIQEVRDNTSTAISKLEDALGPDYDYVIGPRLGRTSSKEQYAFIYRKDVIKMLDSTTCPDPEDVFHREPFMGHFRAVHGGFDFVLMNIHTDPDDAAEEIAQLPDAISMASSYFKEPDVIALGDYNADGKYFKERTYTTIFPAEKYIWIIPNDADTTVAESARTYDRIVTTKAASEDFSSSWGVFRFDCMYNLNSKQAKKISDHYPVWADFYADRDTE